LIDLNPDTVRHIIDKAREYHIKDALEGAERSEEPEDAIEDWTDREPTPDTDDETYRELTSTIGDLEPDQQIQLVALMWVGRGDYDIDEWETAIDDAAQAHNERTAQYLIATPLLADYLEEALHLHGYEED
jgi:hypothetical protein